MAELVERVLRLCVVPEFLTELQSQPSFESVLYSSTAVRSAVYPFRHGHDLNSNFVTLLLWAEELAVEPQDLNRFFNAKYYDKEAWRRAEQDRGRRAFYIPLHPCGVGILWGGLIVSAAVISYLLVVHGIRSVQQVYFSLVSQSWLYGVLYALPSFTSMCLVEACTAVVPSFALEDHVGSANPLLVWADDVTTTIQADGKGFFWDEDAFTFFAILSWALLLESVCWEILLTPLGTVAKLALTSLGVFVSFWLPGATIFNSGKGFYLRKPNRVVDIYDDPHSRHWVQISDI